MIAALLYLLILVLIFALIAWIISTFVADAGIKKIANAILIVVAVVCLIAWLLELAGATSYSNHFHW